MYPTTTPPLDQRIIDEYFNLTRPRNRRGIAWLFGMMATYGIKPEELKGFTWNIDNSITVNHKKRPVRPLHPQWVLLFQLKEKQPSKLEGCWNSFVLGLYRSMASAEVTVNITDLVLGYKIRKSFYKPKVTVKQQSKIAPVVCASAS